MDSYPTDQPVIFDDATWAAVQSLAAAGEALDRDAMKSACVAAAQLDEGRHRGVLASLSRGTWFCLVGIAGGEGLNLDGIREVAEQIHPRVSLLVPFDMVEVEHMLREPFGLSDWPMQNLSYAHYLVAAAVTFGQVRAGTPDPYRSDEHVRGAVEKWLADGS